jgi:hypothetical protein
MLVEPWSTVTAGYIDKVTRISKLPTGIGGMVYFPENACRGRCVLDAGTTGKAQDPAGAIGKSFLNMIDSFTLRIFDIKGNLVGKNVEVCFTNPGSLYVYGLNGENWGPAIETVFSETRKQYCTNINAEDLGVNNVLYFAYFAK